MACEKINEILNSIIAWKNCIWWVICLNMDEASLLSSDIGGGDMPTRINSAHRYLLTVTIIKMTFYDYADSGGWTMLVRMSALGAISRKRL